jgi:hypothetical protein
MRGLYVTTVVNIKTCPDFNPWHNPNDVYIGRFNDKSPYGVFEKSKWHNPYKGEPNDVLLEKFRQYVLQKPELLAQIPELKGKRLGCWCHPKDCHGHLLADWADNGIPPH